MATLFAQSIAQFAPLRTIARIHTTTPYSQLIRELFPKALFDEQKVSYKVFMKIAWSFLSSGIMVNDKKYWRINQMEHRIGGLPAIISMDGLRYWYKNGKCQRDDKDPKTGLTLPAFTSVDGTQKWYKYGALQRDDEDPRTGLTLPAIIHNSSLCWLKNDVYHRIDKDPNTGLTLPAVIYRCGTQKWYKYGVPFRDDKDPNTGLTLPVIIRAYNTQTFLSSHLTKMFELAHTHIKSKRNLLYSCATI